MGDLICLDRFAKPGEAKVARRLVRLCMERGFAISVHDGEEWAVKRSQDRAAILAELATTDMTTVKVWRPLEGEAATAWAPGGSFLLVWGNEPDGSELIADHTDNELCNELAELASAA